MGLEVGAPLAVERNKVRHNPELLALAVKLAETGRSIRVSRSRSRCQPGSPK